MANFSALKQSIQNYIKQNGNKEITGNLLQEILLSMVTTMGDGAINDNASDISDIQNEIQNIITTRLNTGALYAGYATPSTTPAALTSQEVFYLATQAGTYTNFHFNGGDDPIVLTKDGIYFIVSGLDDDDWNAETMLQLDDVPTASSNNAVKSGGVAEELALGAVYDVSAKNPTAGPNNDGKWESLSALLSDANLNTLIPTSVRKGGMSIKFIQSSDNKYVQFHCITNYFTTDVTAWYGMSDKISFKSEDCVKGGAIYDSISKTNLQTGGILEFNENVGYMNEYGTFDENASFHCKYVDLKCKEGDKFLYKGNARWGAYSWVIFNGNTVIDNQQYDNINTFATITIPTNATRIRISSFASSDDDVIMEVRGEDALITIIEETAEELKQEIENIEENTSFDYTESIGYMDEIGDIVLNPSFHCRYTDYNVSEGDRIIYKGVAKWGAQSYVIFNDSTVISYGVIDGAQIITIPANATRIRLCSMDAAANPIVFEVGKEGTLNGDVLELKNIPTNPYNTHDYLYGKKLYCAGDSFTAGDYTGDTTGTTTFPDGRFQGQNKVYPRFIALRNNMQLTMDAESGTTMAVTQEYADNPADDPRHPYAYQRYMNIPADADYITIWFGINDDAPIGNIDDSSISTFYGAWNTVIEWIIRNRPSAKVGIIVTNIKGATYREVEKNIGEKWGIPVLDLMGDSNVPDFMGKDLPLYTQTARNLRYAHWEVGNGNGHPNQFCHEYISTFIEAFLRRL